jgi:ribosomal protein L11 methyltransferase
MPTTSPSENSPFLLFRVTVPSIWDESLVWLIAEFGFGNAVAEVSYPAGAVESDTPNPTRASEVRILVSLACADALRLQIPIWLGEFGVVAADWQCAEEPHSAEERFDANLWQQAWKPFRCAGYVVHADFHSLAPGLLRSADIPLTLKTGSAFGTGTHPTTRLALKAIQKWCVDGPPARLLDVGTGSGILSVAAALGGIKEVTGMDPDPFSAAQANAMASLNQVGEACTFWRGGFDSAAGQWPVVVANLVADIIQQGAGSLGHLVESQGVLFAGGILRRHWLGTAAALQQEGLTLQSSSGRGRWLAGIWVKS